MLNKDEFIAHVLRCFPEEACGYVSGGLFVSCPNLSGTPLDAFEIALDDPAWADGKVEYIVHSHTSAFPDSKVDPRTPSRADMECQDDWGLPFAIVHCDGETVSEPVFFGTYERRPPLEGRDFVFSANDCLTLMADYMHEKHSIELPSCPRDWDWFAHGETLIDDLWHDWGFDEVSLADARPSDVLLFRMGTRFTNHIGVYLGSDQVLHHGAGNLSCVEECSRFVKYIYKVIRHRDIK
jgi:proteasome lid subunit RPN8/RPN11